MSCSPPAVPPRPTAPPPTSRAASARWPARSRRPAPRATTGCSPPSWPACSAPTSASSRPPDPRGDHRRRTEPRGPHRRCRSTAHATASWSAGRVAEVAGRRLRTTPASIPRRREAGRRGRGRRHREEQQAAEAEATEAQADAEAAGAGRSRRSPPAPVGRPPRRRLPCAVDRRLAGRRRLLAAPGGQPEALRPRHRRPALAGARGLTSDTVLRLHPHDFDRLGVDAGSGGHRHLVEGLRVAARAARRPHRARGGRGHPPPAGGRPSGALIDATARVTEIRVVKP